MRLDRTDAAQSILPGVRAGFNKGFAGAEPQWQKFAGVWPSNSLTETYPRLVGTGGPREWKASRVVTGGEEHYLQVTNKKYEVTMRVDWDLILYDKLKQVDMLAQGKGLQMAMYRDELMLELLAAAGTTASYNGDDGTYVVATDHAEGESGTQSNKGTTALSADSLGAGRIVGLGIKDAAGKPTPVVYDTLVVGPSLAKTAWELVTTPLEPGVAENTGNWNYRALDVVINAYQTDTNDWFLACTKNLLKPMGWQSVEEPHPVYVVKDALHEEQFVDYGTHMIGRAFFTDWRLVYGAIVA